MIQYDTIVHQISAVCTYRVAVVCLEPEVDGIVRLNVPGVGQDGITRVLPDPGIELDMRGVGGGEPRLHLLQPVLQSPAGVGKNIKYNL